ncbi:MAG: hypothetical protein WC444_01225 [Candidatus Paceibacterota bacterium]
MTIVLEKPESALEYFNWWLMRFYSVSAVAAVFGLLTLVLRRAVLSGPEWQQEWFWSMGIGMTGCFFTPLVMVLLQVWNLMELRQGRVVLLVACSMFWAASSFALFAQAGTVYATTITVVCAVVLPAIATVFLFVHIAAQKLRRT